MDRSFLSRRGTLRHYKKAQRPHNQPLHRTAYAAGEGSSSAPVKTFPITFRVVSAAAIALTCGYFVLGVFWLAASEQPGTSIHFYQLLSVDQMWREFRATPVSLAVRYFPLVLGSWFFAAVYLSIYLLCSTRLLRSRAGPCLVGAILGVSSVVGFFGLYSFLFTLVNAFFLRGLDGEWVNEACPIADASGLIYVVLAAVTTNGLLRLRRKPRPVA